MKTDKLKKAREPEKENSGRRRVHELVSTSPDNFIVMVQVIHQSKYYSAYIDIPPEKQKMEYIRQRISGLAGSADRKIKELLFGPK